MSIGPGKPGACAAIDYWHVNAFAARPFAGNQAAVMVLDDWLPDRLLQQIAAENMFSETAFVKRDAGDRADWQLRWFTPATEVVLCGHATLASGHVLLGREGGERITFATRKAGLLEVRRTPSAYTLRLPATEVAPHRDERLLEVLGARGEVFLSLDKGRETAIVLMQDEASVRALSPDFARLKDIALMVICTAPGDSSDIVSRVFVSAYGIDEDPVTGSAHAALGPFWQGRLGKDRISAHQASARGGDLLLRVEPGHVWVEGACVTVVEGRFYLSG